MAMAEFDFSSTCEADYLLVAAIDFGTTYSGYAYSFCASPRKIITNSAWVAGSRSLLSLKTPTCLLLNPEKQFDSFGYDAESKYAHLSSENKHMDWYYFKHFKMILHMCSGYQNFLLDDIHGKPIPALTVFSLCIGYLKDHLMTSLTSKVPEIRQSDVMFVLTVPAIWGDTARRFMRSAAAQAGIDDMSLKIALEPEAASLWCQSVQEEMESRKLKKMTGHRFIVADLGGGTADMTVHEMTLEGTLKELLPPSGGPWGGRSIDVTFMDLLISIVGYDVIQAFIRSQTEDYIDLMREFEVKKRTISLTSEGKITMKIPVSLKDLYEEGGRRLTDAVSSSEYSHQLSWTGDKLRLDIKLIKDLFSDTINNLIRHIHSILSEPGLGDIRTILLVGGFSECQLVEDAVRRNFPHKSVIVPLDSGTAVLKGAVLFGHRPQSIGSRISRHTYGLRVFRDFKDDEDPPEYKCIKGGIAKCDNVFDQFVMKGQEIKAGEEFKCEICPSTDECQELIYKVYASDKIDPVYTTEEDCHLIGTFTVPLPMGATKEEKKVEETMVVGDTEIMLRIKPVKTGIETCYFCELP